VELDELPAPIGPLIMGDAFYGETFGLWKRSDNHALRLFDDPVLFQRIPPLSKNLGPPLPFFFFSFQELHTFSAEIRPTRTPVFFKVRGPYFSWVVPRFFDSHTQSSSFVLS